MSLPKEKEASKSPAETVIGWVLVFFSCMVMTFGYNNGQIDVAFWMGVAMVPVGIICIVLGKQKQKGPKICSTGKEAH
ncbi:MAG: hypothetical protein AB1611_03505 [bacterium]